MKRSPHSTLADKASVGGEEALRVFFFDPGIGIAVRILSLSQNPARPRDIARRKD
jgi:hypothetical protein